MKKFIVLITLLTITGESRAAPLTVMQRNIYSVVSAATVGILTTACLYLYKNEPSEQKLLALRLVCKHAGRIFNEAKYIRSAKAMYAKNSILAGLCTAATTGTIVFYVLSSHLKIPNASQETPEKAKKKPKIPKKLGLLPHVDGFIDFLGEELEPILPEITVTISN